MIACENGGIETVTCRCNNLYAVITFTILRDAGSLVNRAQCRKPFDYVCCMRTVT